MIEPLTALPGRYQCQRKQIWRQRLCVKLGSLGAVLSYDGGSADLVKFGLNLVFLDLMDRRLTFELMLRVGKAPAGHRGFVGRLGRHLSLYVVAMQNLHGKKFGKISRELLRESPASRRIQFLLHSIGRFVTAAYLWPVRNSFAHFCENHVRELRTFFTVVLEPNIHTFSVLSETLPDFLKSKLC